jgi:hypothetical protein
MSIGLFSSIVFFGLLRCSSSTLVDGRVTLSWSASDRPQLIDRFFGNRTRIDLKVLCRDPIVSDATIDVSGRIGRVIGCLSLQSDASPTSYEEVWQQMEYRTFQARQSSCALSGAQLTIDRYSGLIRSSSSPLTRSVQSAGSGPLLSWAEGLYLIEINVPETNAAGLQVDVIVSMKNRRGGFLTADEYPALIFYAVMCGVYAFFALIWMIWCAFFWRDLMKIQFWIAGVILIGMFEKSAFVAEYDILNRTG